MKVGDVAHLPVALGINVYDERHSIFFNTFRNLTIISYLVSR